MTVTASVFPAWGNPMQMPCSLALIVLTARASVSPLCARGSLSFQRVTPPLAPSRFLPPRDLWGKNSGAEDLSARLRVSSRRLRSRVSRSRHTERFLPSFFFRPDQHPSGSASDLVSFGGSDDELADDSMSLAASDAEELSGSITDPAPSRLPAPSAAKAGMDAELFRVLSKAVKELGLEWSPPEEPSRSRLDEWFLSGRRQASQQRPSPFFPEVHDELTRSWRSPYSARLRTSASSALTIIDGAEEKRYERMPQLDESVAAHLCPPTAIGWKAKASHLSKSCRTTSALAGRSYASAGQAASALHTMAVLQVYQAKLLFAW